MRDSTVTAFLFMVIVVGIISALVFAVYKVSCGGGTIQQYESVKVLPGYYYHFKYADGTISPYYGPFDEEKWCQKAADSVVGYYVKEYERIPAVYHRCEQFKFDERIRGR